jgi:hypothetical protein
MLRGTIKVDPKKDVCHFALVIEALMQHLFPKIEPYMPIELALAKAQ